MTDITVEKVGIYTLIICAIVFFLACFINGVVYIAKIVNFKWESWEWHTWFLFISSCILIVMTGVYLIPTIQIRLNDWLKSNKERTTKKHMIKTIYKKILEKDN